MLRHSDPACEHTKSINTHQYRLALSLNWVSAIKGDIYVKNVVTVGHIFCCMLPWRKHKDTFVGFTHC